MPMLLLIPVAMGLCFFALWLGFRYRWSRMAVTLACATIMGISTTIYFAYPRDQAVCPLGGIVFGATFGAAIGWTAFGAGHDAIQRRRKKGDSSPSSK